MVGTASDDEPTSSAPTKTPSSKRQVNPTTIAREAKRHRLNVATNTLSKPFRSPLLSGRKPTNGTTAQIPPGSPPSSADATPCKPRKPLTPRGRPIAFAKQSTDPELAALYKQRSTLESTLRSKKALLETVLQALKIETASPEDSDEKLEELIEKWKGAARGAADVLFEFASERVNNMGSSGGWKEMIRPKNPWDDEKPQIEQGGKAEEEDDDVCYFELTFSSLVRWLMNGCVVYDGGYAEDAPYRFETHRI